MDFDPVQKLTPNQHLTFRIVTPTTLNFSSIQLKLALLFFVYCSNKLPFLPLPFPDIIISFFQFSQILTSIKPMWSTSQLSVFLSSPDTQPPTSTWPPPIFALFLLYRIYLSNLEKFYYWWLNLSFTEYSSFLF